MLAGMDRPAGSATAVIVAAGTGERLGADRPKAFVSARGRPILATAALAASASPAIGAVVVAVPEGTEELARQILAEASVAAAVVTGGPSRQASVTAALSVVDPAVDVIVVHDAARVLAGPDLFDRVVDAVLDGADGAVPGLPIADTIKRVRDGTVVSTVDRSDLVASQTPQAFRAVALRTAHAEAAPSGAATDDAALVEAAGFTVRVVAGDPANVKVTTPADLARLEGRVDA